MFLCCVSTATALRVIWSCVRPENARVFRKSAGNVDDTQVSEQLFSAWHLTEQRSSVDGRGDHELVFTLNHIVSIVTTVLSATVLPPESCRPRSTNAPFPPLKLRRYCQNAWNTFKTVREHNSMLKMCIVRACDGVD